MKLLKILQYAYLIFAGLFIFEAISNWSINRERSYIMLLLAALAVFIFFFRKHFRKKFEDRNNAS